MAAKSATADRSPDVFAVICPHCEERTEFYDWSEVYIFVCRKCGEPVEVIDPLQQIDR
jgi:transcription initiation factor IIE alpha subunit